MKDELQDKLVEILTSIQVATGKASDFAVTQLPDIAQSYILYGRVTTLITVVAWLVAAVVSLLMLKWLWEKPRYCEHPWNRDREVRTDGNQFCVLQFCVASVFTVVNVFSSLTSAALVWFAPKVWLLKELAFLIK